jgi:hypothetical protein
VQQGPRVAITIAALALTAALAPSARAGNRIALVGCDLTAIDGPTATFLQISGESNQDNRTPGFANDGVVSNPGSTIDSGNSLSSSDSNDVVGRSCARVMADLVDDGFQFRSAEVSGGRLNQWLSIWQANN